LTDIIAFKSEHSYLANDARLDSIVAQLNRAEHHLQLGDYERAMQLIDEANRLFDRLKIEAQRTMLLDRTGQSVMTLVAIHQTDTTSRFMSDVHLLVQSSLLLDIDNQECIVAIKRQVGFTVRTEHTLHRRVPLSDEEANVLFHFAHFIQRLPSSNARSLFVLLAG
jgi:exonuclease VII small subunit